TTQPKIINSGPNVRMVMLPSNSSRAPGAVLTNAPNAPTSQQVSIRWPAGSVLPSGPKTIRIPASALKSASLTSGGGQKILLSSSGAPIRIITTGSVTGTT